MTGKAQSIGEAVRNARRALGLRQSDFAKRVLVARETVSAWEQCRTTPTHEQRRFTVTSLADVAPEVLMPLVEAFGVAAPPGTARSRRPAGADAAGRILSAIRAAADELDVPASALRRTLAVVLAHAAAAGASLDDAATVLSPAPPGQAANRRGGK
jgi:transcriptional regulator with XRE-family HTH domain